jgi:hypothetical protein
MNHVVFEANGSNAFDLFTLLPHGGAMSAGEWKSLANWICLELTEELSDLKDAMYVLMLSYISQIG